MTTQEYNLLSKALENVRMEIVEASLKARKDIVIAFDEAMNKIKGIEFTDYNMCARHLKVDCMCDEPNQ